MNITGKSFFTFSQYSRAEQRSLQFGKQSCLDFSKLTKRAQETAQQRRDDAVKVSLVSSAQKSPSSLVSNIQSRDSEGVINPDDFALPPPLPDVKEVTAKEIKQGNEENGINPDDFALPPPLPDVKEVSAKEVSPSDEGNGFNPDDFALPPPLPDGNGLSYREIKVQTDEGGINPEDYGLPPAPSFVSIKI